MVYDCLEYLWREAPPTLFTLGTGIVRREQANFLRNFIGDLQAITWFQRLTNLRDHVSSTEVARGVHPPSAFKIRDSGMQRIATCCCDC